MAGLQRLCDTPAGFTRFAVLHFHLAILCFISGDGEMFLFGSLEHLGFRGAQQASNKLGLIP